MNKGILCWALFLLISISCVNTKASEVIIGEGEELSQYGPFDTRYGGNIIQIILAKEELQRAGAVAGNLSSIAFHAQGNDVTTQLKRFRVRVSAYYQEYFVDNIFANPLHIALGDDTPESVFNIEPNQNTWINIELTNPFTWNGNSHILIEIAWTNGDNGRNNQPHNLYAHRVGDEDNVRYLYKRQNNVPNLSAFDRPEMTTLRPKVKLTFLPAEPVLEIANTKMDMGYLDEFSISDYRSVEFSARNLTPQEGEIVCTPSQGLLVSQDLENWKEYPQTLSIPYSNAKAEDKAIFCKMKSGNRAEEYLENLKIKVPGIAEKIVHFSANGGKIFQYYCKSSAYETKGGDISNISLYYDDGLIFTNGQAQPIYNRIDCGNKYSNFTNMKSIPLRENTEYRIKVSVAHSGSTAKSGKIKMYIDYDRNAVFGIDEQIWTQEQTRDGSDLQNNDYWGRFTMPSRVRLGGDSECMLRIVYDEDNRCEACGTYITGETEDYAVKLLEDGYPLKTALSGEYTIGGNPENEKHYNNLQNLVTDIEKYGIGGDVTLAINTNLNIPEGKSIEIRNPSKYKVSIYPKGKTRNISGSLAETDGKAMLQLSGNIEINGKIDNESERNALKIKNLATDGTAICIIQNSGESTRINNINIESNNGIKISGKSNSKIDITNCKILTRSSGIIINGESNSSISIRENLFSKGGGIMISGSENALIDNNEFDLSSSAEDISNYTISLVERNNNIRISNNIIHYIGNGECSGGIRINSTQNRDICIFNNAINCNNASSGIICDGRNIKLYHNTVYVNGAENSAAINILGGEGICLKNNIFINNGVGVACAIRNSSSIAESKCNNYYAKNEERTICENEKNMSFPQWQEKSGKDENSTSERVTLLEKMREKCILSLESAMNEKLLAPSISDVKEDILGRERSVITQKGVDEAIPEYEIGELPDNFKLCTPDTIKLKISAKLLRFNDDIKRGESKNYPHKYRYYWRKNGVVVDSTADIYLAKIDGQNLNNPIEYYVEVATHGHSKKSNTCKVYSEQTIAIRKEPAELYELGEKMQEVKIDFEADGTISGYQWQKLVKSKWEDLPGEHSNSIIVSTAKHGAGTYRALIYDGEYKCNKGSCSTKRAKVTVKSGVQENEIIRFLNNKIIVNCEERGYGKVEVYDLLGRRKGELLLDLEANTDTVIDIDNYEKSIYFVIIFLNDTTKVTKIIKKSE